MTHADEVIEWLENLGYTHCFFVAGGNSMHLLNSARRTMKCVAFVHEVSAGIAAEYFNQTELASGKAFVLVTAGPGMTNLVTALGGAFLESRELLVIGGQVKSADLSFGEVRQRGIQEIDGVSIANPICKFVCRVETPIKREFFERAVKIGSEGRPGPVFIEFCLDAQGVGTEAILQRQDLEILEDSISLPDLTDSAIAAVVQALLSSERPVLLIGGGVSRRAMTELRPLISASRIPVMTTWNAADRIGSDDDLYLGRPNTWGQRSSNILLQQSDFLIAVGTRLGMQQTGFNWQEFLPLGQIVHVDIDKAELNKGHPVTDFKINADAVEFLERFLLSVREQYADNWVTWKNHGQMVRKLLPLSEDVNQSFSDFCNPFDFVQRLSEVCQSDDIVIPCSSGGAFTVMMQAFEQKLGQVLVTDKGLASMGYGLAGAIGAALSSRDRRTILVEGDGGFSQNLQELATVDVQNLNLKIFIFSNEGYASIRMTQKNYFDGAYLGCDTQSGLGFPNWKVLASAFGISASVFNQNSFDNNDFLKTWNSQAPHIYVVPIHPEQTYYPKIASRVAVNGGMESAPLHLMTPELTTETLQKLHYYSVE